MRNHDHLFLDVETYSPGPKPTHDDMIIAIAYKQEDGPITYSVARTTFSGGLASQDDLRELLS